MGLVDRLVVMDFGCKLIEGPPALVRADPRVQEAYLGSVGMTPLLAIEDFHVAYGKVEAVRGVNLALAPGQIVTVIGPNGAGKTTLLAAAAGLLRSRGKVIYDGVDIGRLDVEERVERGFCLVPERRELFGDMAVVDNLVLGAYCRRRNGADVKQSLQQVYQRFPRLAERRKQKAQTLSGGERQMLALGRALMAKPRLLLLDEPSLGLGAADGARNSAHRRLAARHRRLDPVGRAERPRRARNRGLRLRAGIRRDHPSRHRRRARRRRPRGRDLSRRIGLMARAPYDDVVLAAPVTVPYVRFSTKSAHWFLGRALAELIAAANIPKARIDGLAVASFTLAPDSAVGLTQHLGLTLRWLDHVPMGGASGIVSLRRAARAVQAGDAEIVACIAGDTNHTDSFRRNTSAFSQFSQDAVYPYGSGGPNTSFAFLTAYYMRAVRRAAGGLRQALRRAAQQRAEKSARSCSRSR